MNQEYNKTFLRSETLEDARDSIEEVYDSNPDAIIIVEEEGKECMIEHDKQLNFVPSGGKKGQVLTANEEGNPEWGKALDTQPFIVVEALPDTPDTNNIAKIHLVPNTEGKDDNLFDEYLWADNKWEKLGTAKIDIDLSAYLTIKEAQQKYFPLQNGDSLKQKVGDIQDLIFGLHKDIPADEYPFIFKVQPTNMEWSDLGDALDIAVYIIEYIKDGITYREVLSDSPLIKSSLFFTNEGAMAPEQEESNVGLYPVIFNTISGTMEMQPYCYFFEEFSLKDGFTGIRDNFGWAWFRTELMDGEPVPVEFISGFKLLDAVKVLNPCSKEEADICFIKVNEGVGGIYPNGGSLTLELESYNDFVSQISQQNTWNKRFALLFNWKNMEQAKTVMPENVYLTTGLTQIYPIIRFENIPNNGSTFSGLAVINNTNNLPYFFKFTISSNSATTKIIQFSRYNYPSVSTTSFSDLTTPTLAMARLNSKKLSIEAGKQYFNEVAGRTITSYEGFSASNPTATILSSEPVAFEGDNILEPVEIPDSEYLLYKVEYVQTSDIKFILVVSVTAMKAPSGGLKGEDIPVAEINDIE